jgi:hypothetical protein
VSAQKDTEQLISNATTIDQLHERVEAFKTRMNSSPSTAKENVFYSAWANGVSFGARQAERINNIKWSRHQSGELTDNRIPRMIEALNEFATSDRWAPTIRRVAKAALSHFFEGCGEKCDLCGEKLNDMIHIAGE